MFTKKSKSSFEGSPLEVLRRYAPYLVGAAAAIGTTVALYYTAFTGGKNMVDTTQGSVTSVMTTATDKTNEIIGNL